MKLRIKGDSLRLRLTQSEVRSIAQGNFVEEKTWFSESNALVYSLETSSSLSKVEALFIENRIRVIIPEKQALQWARSEEVALKDTFGKLFILIEKDFACLKPRYNQLEDESDLFTNPNEAHGRCQ